VKIVVPIFTYELQVRPITTHVPCCYHVIHTAHVTYDRHSTHSYTQLLWVNW